MTDNDTDRPVSRKSDLVENGYPKRRASDFEDSKFNEFLNYAFHVGKGATGLLSFGALYPAQDKKTKELQFAFSTDEVRSLIRYASEEGINPELVADTYKKLRICEECNGNQSDTNTLDKARVSLLKAYTELCHATKNVSGNVTGRTVRDSIQLSRHTARLVIITFSFLLWGLLAEAVRFYIGDKSAADIPKNIQWLWYVYEYGLRILNPFFWGGLGACVYVLKRSYDAARIHAFDTETFNGWGVRVVLGFVLGGAVLYIIDPQKLASGGGDSQELGAGVSVVVVAFLTGLATKVVYGALEKLIIEISSRFQLDNVQPARRSVNAVNEFLAEQLSKIDPQRDKEKYNLLVDLLKDRGAPIKSD